MEKNFEFGLILGRFHILHNGHKQIIEMARTLCEKTLILIGSEQVSGTFRNPFKIETRREMVEKIYGEESDVIIGTLKDMTNEKDICFEWGRYILDNVKEMYGRIPDLMVYGKDESRKGWFSEEDMKKFSELIIARSRMDISATSLRECLVEGQQEKWKSQVPEQIWNLYEPLRKELLEVEAYGNKK